MEWKGKGKGDGEGSWEGGKGVGKEVVVEEGEGWRAG